MSPPNEELAESLREFYLRAHRTLDRLMTAHGASLARTKLLMRINAAGPVRPSDLSDALGQAPRTITEAIDGLERDGLVRREPDPTDRRAKRITITAEGAAALARAEPARREFFDAVFGSLDEAERLAFQRLMERLNRQVAALEARAGAEAP